jgi:hypothetical protein
LHFIETHNIFSTPLFDLKKLKRERVLFTCSGNWSDQLLTKQCVRGYSSSLDADVEKVLMLQTTLATDLSEVH